MKNFITPSKVAVAESDPILEDFDCSSEIIRASRPIKRL